MSYTKQTWTTGDTVTATKLNHMEDGIADGQYDAIFSVYIDAEGVPTVTILKGDYATIYTKMTTGTLPPRILYLHKEDTVGTSASYSNVTVTLGEDVVMLYITASSMPSYTMGFTWDSNDEIAPMV